jgi:energy-coupling factor transporter transmembrane protein EcfT
MNVMNIIKFILVIFIIILFLLIFTYKDFFKEKFENVNIDIGTFSWK